MRIYAFAASTDQLSKLELIKTDLDTKCKKICPNYPGINVVDSDRRLIERWVLQFPEEVVYFDGLLNTILFRLGETN
jgi:hypothetical protein